MPLHTSHEVSTADGCRVGSFASEVVNPGRLVPGTARGELPIPSASYGFIRFPALEDSQMPLHISHEVSTADGVAPKTSRRKFRAENSKPPLRYWKESKIWGFSILGREISVLVCALKTCIARRVVTCEGRPTSQRLEP